jgi:AcrR family transcriptional regulator
MPGRISEILAALGYHWYPKSIGMAATKTRKAPTRAERKARTRTQLIAAAERLFKRDGFHATSVDLVADEAGYTKGAVYSNFASKEDLFFAVYERRLDERIAELHRLADEAPSARASLRASVETAGRRGEDGWMAVFFEFWAHVLRHPEHRERFAALHRRALEPFVRGVEEFAREEGIEPPLPPALLATAHLALGNGLQLERLTRPEEVDVEAMQQAQWLLARATAPFPEGETP